MPRLTLSGCRAPLAVAILLAAASAHAYTPTQTFGPSPTPTPTGTQPAPQPVITAVPNPARSGQRVLLDGRGSYRPGGFLWSQAGGDVMVDIEDADQAVASFVVPPLTAPADVSIQLSLFGGLPAQLTVALQPADTVRVEIGRVTGAPGDTVDVDVVLRPLGYAVTELRHELQFDRVTPVAAAGDSPACTAGPDLDVDSAAFVFLPAGCTPDVDCTAVRAEIVTGEPIPDGAVAYRCSVRIIEDDDPETTCTYPLACGDGQARRANGNALGVVCLDGEVFADYAVRPLSFGFNADPSNPAVGDTVRLGFGVNGEGGLPAYTLFGAAPFLRIVTAPPPSGGPLGHPIEFETVADCPGVAHLSLFVTYETRCGCAPNPFFCFRSATSPTYSLTVSAPGGFAVSGRVAEFPAGCQGAMRGVTVQLDPLGWTTETDLADGTFSFGGVPTGDYTLSVDPPCNPFGCWAPQPIQVVDADVAFTLCPEPAAPPGCAGDCDADGHVMIHELVAGISIALGVDDLPACRAADSDGNGSVAIDDLTRAVGRALEGCPAG